MKNNLNLFNEPFMLAWAIMPLCADELKNIPYSHRKRPYLLCLEKEKYFYAFPATSKITKCNVRYQNAKVIINSGFENEKSLIKLETVYKLPKENIIGDKYLVNGEYTNEIIKKIKTCSLYNNYPEEFTEYYKNKKFLYSINDLVEVNDKLYVIIGYKTQNEFYVLPVYSYLINNTVTCETDGLKYYVDTDHITLLNGDNITSYRTQLPGFFFGKTMKNQKNLMTLLSIYKRMKKDSCDTDFTIFGNLLPGMIISYQYKNIINKIIVIKNFGDSLEVMIGLDSMQYKDFEALNLPCDIYFPYHIIGTLTKDRLARIETKSMEKLKVKEKRSKAF